MIEETKSAVTALLKREPANIVAGTGLFFRALAQRHESFAVEDLLESHRSGVWGDESADGVGFPVLRSTNMRGNRADVRDAAWRQVAEKQAAGCALRSGDILVTKSSGSSDLVGKAVLFEQPGDGWTYLFSNFTHRLRPDTRRIDPRFLAWFLRSPQSLSWRFEAQQNAVGLRNLQTGAFLAQRVPVPSLTVQRAIADYLDALETGHAESVRLPADLLEQGRIVARIEALAPQVEEARSLRSQATEEADALMPSARNSCVRSLREHCQDVALGDVCVNITDGPHVSPRYVDQGVPFISVRNIRETGIDFSSAKFVTVEDHDVFSKKAMVEVGDVLYTKGGTTGIARRVDTERPFSIWVHVALLKLRKDQAEASFVEHMLNAPTSKEQAELFTRGSSNRDLGLSRMSKIKFPLPPLSDQVKIVADLDALQVEAARLRRLQTETAEEIEALMPAILDRAFKGEL